MTDNSERIDKFLHEQMTPEENEAFLKDLRTDKELRDEAQVMALLIKAMREEQVKQDAEIIDEVLASKRKARIIRMVKWGASIAAMLVIVFGGVHIYKINQINHLFKEYYSAYDVSLARGGDDEAIKEELAILYNKVGTEKDVTPIIARLQTIYDNIQSNNEYYLDYGYYENDIAWYLALAYIKDHKLDKAKELLKPLAEDGVTEAEELLKKLTNL